MLYVKYAMSCYDIQQGVGLEKLVFSLRNKRSDEPKNHRKSWKQNRRKHLTSASRASSRSPQTIQLHGCAMDMSWCTVNEARSAQLAITNLVSNKCEWNNFLINFLLNPKLLDSWSLFAAPTSWRNTFPYKVTRNMS